MHDPGARADCDEPEPKHRKAAPGPHPFITLHQLKLFYSSNQRLQRFLRIAKKHV